jgi:hypothetical protein
VEVADRSSPDDRQDRFNLRRRTLLGTSLGASAALIAGTELSDAEPRTPRKSAAERHVRVHQFDGSALTGGTHSGTEWSTLGLTMLRSTGVLDYTDPFATDPVPVSFETASWLSPVVSPGFDYNELIGSWQAGTPGNTWLEIAVRGTDETGAGSGWYLLGRWCEQDPSPSAGSGSVGWTGSGSAGAIHRTSVTGQGTELATVWTDTLHVNEPHLFSDWQLRVTLLRPVGSEESPVLRAVGAMASRLPDAKKVSVSPVGVAAGTVLDVPTFSQEKHVGHYPQWDNGGEAWCSPTSVAMVLKYWQRGPSATDLEWVDPPVDAEVDFAARNVFDYAYQGAGNWPFNTAYAARFGLSSFITRLRSFTEAEELIAAGIPLIISVAFKKSELDGAGYGTNGHLMVVVGFDGRGDVVVNDPASHLIPDNDQVRVTYRRDQLENAWLPKSGGTTYLIHPPQVALPPVLVDAEPNW